MGGCCENKGWEGEKWGEKRAETESICNLGLEHFYAAFGLGCSRDLRVSSVRAFGISENDISEDCSVPSGIATRLRPLTHGPYLSKMA